MSKTAQTIIVTTADRKRLEKAIWPNGTRNDRDVPWYLTALQEELKRAKLVEPRQVPANVVTMNSTVKVRAAGRDSDTYTIVYPESADIAAGYISVLSPMGLALLGSCVGDEVEWSTPAGPRRYVVEELIYQPESARRWDL